MHVPSIRPIVTCVTCFLAATAAIAGPLSSANIIPSTGLTGDHSSHAGLRSIGYYGNWDIYIRKFNVSNIPAEYYSHILYSFAKIDTTTGEVSLSDLHADIGEPYWNDPSVKATELHGNLEQLYYMKTKNRHLKTMLSIGGFTNSRTYVPILESESMRETFARTAVKQMYNFGFDGLSLDYEYVASPTEAKQMVDLLKRIRSQMDKYAKSTDSVPFLLSYAAPAGAENYKKMDLPAMDKYLDFWDFMAYDYAGSWDKTAGHQSNLFPDSKNPISTPFNTDDAINYYINVGKVAPEKLNLGLPLYGRAFAGTDGPGTPYTSIGEGYSWDQGVWDYKAIPEGKVVELPELGASYMYDADKKYMVTYDTPNIARQKAKWIKDKKLGGALFWEVSGDKEGDESLAGTVVKEFGKLENSTNHLFYPQSEYQMLRDGKKDEAEQMEVKEDEKQVEEIGTHNAPIEESTTEVGAPSLAAPSSSTSIPSPTTTQGELADEPTAVATFSTTSLSNPEPSLTATQFEDFDVESIEWYELHEEEEGEEKEEEIAGTEEKRGHAEESKKEKDRVPGAVIKKIAKPSGSSGSLALTTSQFGGVVVVGVVLLLSL